ncbi:hypothetical protein RJT34_14211 [Clitoria ternatea]|uniref:Uncharacterized protein n=1 Tax=Clitoria ternatea TaxID=43366 RepID=A0AAN9JQC6_CLITE
MGSVAEHSMKGTPNEMAPTSRVTRKALNLLKKCREAISGKGQDNEAGFRHYKITHLCDIRSLVDVCP